MVYDLVIFTLKITAAYLFYNRFLKMCYLRWVYGQRGVSFMSTIPKPFIGDTLEFAIRANAQPDRPHIGNIFSEIYGDKTPPSVGMFWPHGMELIVSDPDYVQDLY